MTRLVARSGGDGTEGLPDDWHPVVRRVLAARGISDPSELDMGLHRLAGPDGLTDCVKAASLVADTIQGDGRILVVGDFDADGATSCALVMRALEAMGGRHADYLVPNRFEYGYGLSPEIVAVAVERSPDLLITVDNGISSEDGVAAAQAAGIPVIVTDHHLPGERLPAADAVVNPNRHDDEHPGTALAGVGVAFHLMLQVRAVLRERGRFAGAREPALADWLDLVALGTVADLVPLDRTNRILVEQGLRRIRAGVAAPGILALLAMAGRHSERVNAADLGFAVAPRLNAAGRLEDMTVGIECLLADDPGRARELAERLDDLNRQRRTIETRMRDEAVAAVESLEETMNDLTAPPGLCVYSTDWHEGVVGIVAGRVKEQFHRPVVALAPSGDGTLKGSARSIPGVHMRDLLAAVATRYPGVMNGFGGHAMAAGLSVPAGGEAPFREAFQAVAREWVSPESMTRELVTDGGLAGTDFDLALAATLRTLLPWGQGLPEPLFDNRFTIHDHRIVGERHLKLRASPLPEGPVVDAIAFNAVDRGWQTPGETVQLAYRLDVNRYRGRDRLQIIVEHMQE